MFELTQEQIDRAIEYATAEDTKITVLRKVRQDLQNKNSTGGFPPQHDVDDPNFWWPEHWRWFMKKYLPEEYEEIKNQDSSRYNAPRDNISLLFRKSW